VRHVVIISLLSCTAFLGCVVKCYSQELRECEQDIRGFYAQSASLSFGNGYYAKYGVQTMHKDKTISRQEVLFTIIANQHQIQVLGDQVSTYADDQHLITLSHLAHSIVIGNSSPALFKQMSSQSLQASSDSMLWKAFEVVSCKNMSDQKAYDREVLLKPKNPKSMVTQMVYHYLKGAAGLYRVITRYAQDSELESLVYTFYKVDKTYKAAELKHKNVYSIFFDAKGKLLPAYAKYNIIDQRNKKNN
jgi:hypothetical protein